MSFFPINVIYYEYCDKFKKLKVEIESSKDMSLALKWMPIVDRIDSRKAIMVYKSLNDLVQENMTNVFRFVRQVHTRTTRSSSVNDLYLPQEYINVCIQQC